jgi:hypothetical protein
MLRFPYTDVHIAMHAMDGRHAGGWNCHACQGRAIGKKASVDDPVDAIE